MKAFNRFFWTLAVIGLLAVPVSADEQTQDTEIADQEIVTIEEEEVPLSAVPFSSTSSRSSITARMFTGIGMALVGGSALGIAAVTYNHKHSGH